MIFENGMDKHLIATYRSIIHKSEKDYTDRFTIQNAIATDKKTGLMWLRFLHGQTWQNGEIVGDAVLLDWKSALNSAKKFNQQGGYEGYTDWRLATVDELKSLNCEDIFYPYKPNRVWSSASYANSSYLAWFVRFENCRVVYDSFDNMDNNSAVILVRG